MLLTFIFFLLLNKVSSQCVNVLCFEDNDYMNKTTKRTSTIIQPNWKDNNDTGFFGKEIYSEGLITYVDGIAIWTTLGAINDSTPSEHSDQMSCERQYEHYKKNNPTMYFIKKNFIKILFGIWILVFQLR